MDVNEIIVSNKVSFGRKGFDSEPVYNKKYLKSKIEFYKRKINTNFHDDGLWFCF